ncbi:MAG: universal stress protein [Gaiellaceae bacterium]
MKQIVIAVDGSPEAWYAADVGLDVAAAKGATVTFLHASSETLERIASRDPLLPDRREDLAAAEPVLGEALARARAADVDAQLELSRGSSGEEIVAEILRLADDVEADMIVAGSRGRGAVVSSVLGSVSRLLLREAGVATLIVKVPHARDRG